VCVRLDFVSYHLLRKSLHTLETSTINTALLSHQWSKVCTHQVKPAGDRNSIAYSYVHIVLALRLLGVTVGYYLSIIAFMFSA